MNAKHLIIGALAIVGAVIIYKKFIKKPTVTEKVDTSLGINGAQYLNAEEAMRQSL